MYSKNFKLFLLFITLSLIFIVALNFFLISSIYANDTVYVWSTMSSPVSAPINSDNSNSLNLESASAILIEQSTGQVLYSHNINEQLRPASVTKIMTILLIMESIANGTISLTDSVPCSENAASMGGSQIWLDPKETLTVDEMLKAICVSSANDCSVAMAEYIAGSEESFVAMMNSKADELGMTNTTFKNCHGLDEDGHLTSSYDISLMSRELLNNYPEITNYTTIWMDSLRDGKSELVNTNKLLNSFDGITGLKTGSTGLALYNLSASATREGLSLIAVIMKAPSTTIRFNEAEKLLNYGFSTFTYIEFAKQHDLLKDISILKGTSNSTSIIFEDNSNILVKKGDEQNIEQILTIPEELQAPVYAGEKIGEITYTSKGNTILTSDLIVSDTIPRLNIFTMCQNIIYDWISLLRS